MACGIIKQRANKKSISYFFDFLLGVKGFLFLLFGGVEEKWKNNCNLESLTQFTGSNVLGEGVEERGKHFAF